MKKTISLMVVLTLMLAMLGGCGTTVSSSGESSAAMPSEVAVSETPVEQSTEEPAEAVPAEDSAETVEAAESAEEEIPSASIVYPLDAANESLSIWTSFPGNISNYISSYSENIVVQELETRTGVHLEFTEVSQQTERESFNLMCASGDYNDIIFGFAKAYTGGATKGYEDDIIIALNDYVEECAPDYYRELTANETRMKLAYDENGLLLGVNGFYLNDEVPVTSGIMIRQDWLDELALSAPVTYDDWHEVLTDFANHYDCSSALFLPSGTQSNGGGFVGGYGTAGFQVGARDAGGHFYQVDGVVTSALIEDAYRDYLTMIAQWYAEGLIHPDFYLIQSGGGSTEADELILSDEVGIFSGKVDYISKYEEAYLNGTMNISAITEPVLTEDAVFGFRSQPTSSSSLSISTACDNVALALMWANYWYTDEGYVLANYGVEGTTYNLDAAGNPVYTELLTDNPDGMSFGEAGRVYLFSVPSMITDAAKERVTYSDKEAAAVDLWSGSQEALYSLPAVSFTSDESAEYALLVTDIETYASEEVIKFIIGERSLDTWDDFVQDIRNMQIERCIEIYQNALDRYQNK